MKIGKFSVSYGLIVIVNNTSVVMIERKYPYVLSKYEMYHKKINYVDFRFNFLPKQNSALRWDYCRFRCNVQFEDKYDFPHGQKDKKESDSFKCAMREFEEETGFTFDFPDHIPEPKIVQFTGLDEYFYTQYYYIVHVPSIRTCKMKDTQYSTHVMNIEKAKDCLLRQQSIKKDNKHLLLNL